MEDYSVRVSLLGSVFWMVGLFYVTVKGVLPIFGDLLLFLGGDSAHGWMHRISTNEPIEALHQIGFGLVAIAIGEGLWMLLRLTEKRN